MYCNIGFFWILSIQHFRPTARRGRSPPFASRRRSAAHGPPISGAARTCQVFRSNTSARQRGAAGLCSSAAAVTGCPGEKLTPETVRWYCCCWGGSSRWPLRMFLSLFSFYANLCCCIFFIKLL